jgi:uncharacterized cupredoxin-like copper-binding protein
MNVRRRLVALTAPAVAAAALIPAATGAPVGATTLTVTLDEFSVRVSAHTVPVGTRVRFVVRNRGQLTHEAVLEPAGARNHPLRYAGRATEVEQVQGGGTKSAVWILSKPGDYQIACHVGDHYRRGMVTILHVR